ncbi:MAG: hypothetical protein GXO82_07545 [Chlorobi bacterium]|nr:hypothetical protein [Chlorobiota bacterium]
MISYWKKIPEQTKRLVVLAVILLAVFLVVRPQLVPPDFGELGHFRASALKDIIAQPIRYAGHEVCAECHDEIAEKKSDSYHRNVACEVCHGPAAVHTEEEETDMLRIPRGRKFCIVCHEYLSSRPTGFPQIVSESHNPMKSCITCHNPHDPTPPEKPKDCAGCHASIARSKMVSHHVYVPCIRCHDTPEQHFVNPRLYHPTKPAKREFCGGCHASEDPSVAGIPQVDIDSHGERYVCWQCHYPHLP